MHLLEPGAKISTQDGESDYLFDKVEKCFGDNAAISSHCFIALKTWVKPAKWSAPRIPYMPASCCYLHVRHFFVCGCAREYKCLYVRLKDPPWVQTRVLSHELTNCQEKAPSLCADDGLSVCLTRFSWLRAFTRFSSPLMYFTSSTPFILYSSEGERYECG